MLLEFRLRGPKHKKNKGLNPSICCETDDYWLSKKTFVL